MTFRIRGLDNGQFSHLFALSDAELAAQGAMRKTADGHFPCRVSLTDATPGDEVILVNDEHHAVELPYRMRFAIDVKARKPSTPSTSCQISYAGAHSRCAGSTKME